MSALHNFVLRQVREAFPGQYNIPVRHVAPFIGYAYKTARNMGENFPVATVKQGGLRFVPVAALVEYLVAQQIAAGIQFSDEQPAAVNPAKQPAAGTQPAEDRPASDIPTDQLPKRKAGRPRKLPQHQLGGATR